MLDTGLEVEDGTVAAPQPNCTWLISHVTVVLENALQAKAVTALLLAPANEVNGTVTVWVAPVRPLTTKYLLVYAEAVQAVFVWISRVSEPPAGPLMENWIEL